MSVQLQKHKGGVIMLKTSFRNERFDILNLLRVAVFGNVAIYEHDPNREYKRNDLVYTYDAENHTVTVHKCIVEKTTGEMVNTEWSTSFSGSFKDAIAVSETEPVNHDVQLWFKPIGEERIHNLP